MNLLADESVERQIVERLRQDGHDVLYVAEMEPGISDDIVLERANENRALLLTADKDFGELIFHQNRLNASGVALLRLAGMTPERKAELTATFFHEHKEDLSKTFIVIAQGSIRIRHRE
ncbi:MAG: DUF5615 family PIN-like protein [Acidobacteriota bacterium]